MKKRISSILLCFAMMLCFMNLSAFAAEISEVKVEMPNITATINAKDIDKLDSAAVKATLDGKELNIASAELYRGSMEWIILIDTSKSTKAYFEAEKEAVLSIYKSLSEGDKLSLFTFDTKLVTILNGSESAEDVEKKIKALECNGEDTIFYEATEKLIAMAGESTADNVIPVIFSDGVDTISKNTNKDKTVEKLKNSNHSIYGFYADSLKKETADKFNELLKNSKGSSKAFNAKNASSLLAELKPASTIVVSAAASTDTEAKEDAELSIDLGNGKAITKKTKVEAWSSDTVAPEILSCELNEEAKTVVITFSEEIFEPENADYFFTDKYDGSKIQFSTVEYEACKVTIKFDSCSWNGLVLKVSRIKDKALNPMADKEFILKEAKSPILDLKNIIFVAAGVLLLIIIIVVLAVISKKKKKSAKTDKTEEPKAEVKNDVKAETKPEVKEPVAKTEVVTQPANNAEVEPIEAPAVDPVDAPIEAPVDAPVDTPIDTPVDAPAKASEADKKSEGKSKKDKKSEEKKPKKKKGKDEAQFQFYFVDKK